MKKIFLFITLGILLTGFVFAASITGSTINNSQENQIQARQIQSTTDSTAKATQIQSQKKLTQAQIQKAIQVKNKLRIQAQTGECPVDCTCDGSTIKCPLPNGGREMTIKAGKSGNTIVQVKNANMSTKVVLYKSEGEIYGVFKNNNTKKIKVMPDEIQARLTERIGGLEEHEIELDEEGTYQIQARKNARLFWFIPVKKRVRFEMDSETGEIIKQRTSWWGFLAKDELIVGNKCATVSPDFRDECCQNKGFDFYNQETGECETKASVDEIVENKSQ